MTAYAAARLNMVESQVRPNRVTDPRIVGAMLDLPREGFVPEALRGIAYVDEDVPVGAGRFLMEPMVLARLVQTARIEAGDTVLEIGSGTGYGTAVMAQLAKRVVALESDATLGRQAQTALGKLGIANVDFVTGALNQGHAPAAPYNVIVFGGAVQQIPPRIIDQLAEGGRLVAVVTIRGEPGGRATLITKVADALSRRVVFDAGSHLLPGFELEAGFAF
jgi:protein-L-isoaspartate(D-aspartate) O-methyltransferase